MATRAPSLGRGCRAQRGGVGFLFAAKPPPLCLPPWGRLCPSILFFFTYTYIRFDNARKAVFSFRCLPHWGRRTASAVDRVLSYIVDLRRSFPLVFHAARTLSGSLCSPPSPRGEGFVSRIPLSPSNLRPFGAPPSIGRRECPREPLPLEGAAERSEAGLAFFTCGEAASFLPSPSGKGDRASGG